MKRANKYFSNFITYTCIFIVYTFLLKIIDVKPIGPNDSMVGFATLNKNIYELLGGSQNQFWFNFSERLGYGAIAVCVFFGIVGLAQLIKGKSFKAVDKKIIYLGVFYIIVIALYVLFDKLALNYRPVLETDGSLESSYPSSHTMLAICVFMTMFKQKLFNLDGGNAEKAENSIAATILVTLLIVSRLLSGVHWITDIIGAILISAALVNLYNGSIEHLK